MQLKLLQTLNFDKETLNIVVLGLSFMLLLTTFQTAANVEKTLLNSVSKDDPSFIGDGYISLGIMYIFLAFSNWFTTPLINLVGPKFTMVLGSVSYGLFVGSFLFKTSWLIYLTSALLGAGAAALWAAQGVYLTLSSNEFTIAKNSAIFWTLSQLSLLVGNTFIFFILRGKAEIDFTARTTIEVFLTVVSVLGVLSLLILPSIEIADTMKPKESPLEAFKGAIKLFTSKSMIMMTATSLYSGYEISFYQGIYGSSVGFTNAFGVYSKELIGLNGILIGIGEVIGGAIFVFLGAKLYGRSQIISLGCVTHIVAYVIIFLNLPNNSPFGSTDEVSIIPSNAYLAMMCSFLLGFGDSCYNTQIYSILGFMYPENSAAAFSAFKCIQCFASAACFFLSDRVGLHYQLVLMLLMSVIGSVNFCIVEKSKGKLVKEEQTTEL